VRTRSAQLPWHVARQQTLLSGPLLDVPVGNRRENTFACRAALSARLAAPATERQARVVRQHAHGVHTVCTWCAHCKGIRLAIRTVLFEPCSTHLPLRGLGSSHRPARDPGWKAAGVAVPSCHDAGAHRADASEGKASRQHIGRSCGASGLAVIPQIRSGDCCNAVGGARRAAIGLLSHPSSRCEQKPAARGVHGVHAVDHGQDVHEKGPRYGRSNPKRPASPDES